MTATFVDSCRYTVEDLEVRLSTGVGWVLVVVHFRENRMAYTGTVPVEIGVVNVGKG